MKDGGVSGGSVIENPPANAGDKSFKPWNGRIPHAKGQLSPHTTTTEALSPEPGLRSKRSPHTATTEQPHLHLESVHANKDRSKRSPHTATTERPHLHPESVHANKDPAQPKINQ